MYPSSVLHFIQYLRGKCLNFQIQMFDKTFSVLAYAHWTVKKNGGLVPWKLYVIPIGLCISTPLFIAAWAITRIQYGSTPHGAKIKFILWGVGLIVEAVSHLRMSRLSWLKHPNPEVKGQPESLLKTVLQPDQHGDPPGTLLMPHSDVQTRSRLEAITTIILGEVSRLGQVTYRRKLTCLIGYQWYCRNIVFGRVCAHVGWTDYYQRRLCSFHCLFPGISLFRGPDREPGVEGTRSSPCCMGGVAFPFLVVHYPLVTRYVFWFIVFRHDLTRYE